MTMVTDTKKSNFGNCTAQKIRFSIKDFFSKCDQIRSFLGIIWSHLLKKSVMESFTFCAVSKVLTVSYLVHYDTLLQNAADIIAKCDSYFITKCDKSYDKMRQVFYYKMWQFYYKIRQLLQNASILLQNSTVIAKCGVYYRMRRSIFIKEYCSAKKVKYFRFLFKICYLLIFVT